MEQSALEEERDMLPHKVTQEEERDVLPYKVTQEEERDVKKTESVKKRDGHTTQVGLAQRTEVTQYGN